MPTYFKNLCTLGTILFIPLISCLAVHAQDTGKLSLPSPDEAPLSRISMLPGTRVSSGTIGNWKDRLLPEFIELIRAGKIVVIAQEDRHTAWPNLDWLTSHGPDARLNGSNQDDNQRQIPAASPSAQLTSPGTPYPFGSYDFIEKNSSANERADKILANINSIFSSHGFHRIKADVLNFDNGRLFRGYKFVFERIYPKLIDPSNISAQVFREKTVILEPSSITGLSWLTFRFSGADEDLFFHYSPFAKKSIQLSGPNRLDRIAGTSIALDDLNTWSGKPEMLSVSSFDRSTSFFPISSDKVLKISEQSGTCTTIVKESSSIVLNTNHTESDLADWAPLNIPFIEREIITLNLSTTDFHNPIGKIVVQVDLKTFLPLAKSYYDRSGNLIKFVFSIFNLAEPNSRFNFTPLASFVVDKTTSSTSTNIEERRNRFSPNARKTSDTSVILYRSDERCSALPTDISLNDFDLKGFGIKGLSSSDLKSNPDPKSDSPKGVPANTPSVAISPPSGKNTTTKAESTTTPAPASPTARSQAPITSNKGIKDERPKRPTIGLSLPKQNTEDQSSASKESEADND